MRLSRNNNNSKLYPPYLYQKICNYNDLDVLRSKVIANITNDMTSLVQFQSNKNRYDPVPLLIVSSYIVKQYFKLENCIILSNPRLDGDSMNQICYDIEPAFIGENIRRHKSKFNSLKEGIKVHTIPHRTFAIITPREAFMKVVALCKKWTFLEIKIPDNQLKKDDTTTEEDEAFVLIVCCSNCHDKTKTKESLWTPEFANLVSKAMKKNLVATETTRKKHHGSSGKYYGFGLISKYAINNNHLSIDEFAGNSVSNLAVRPVIDILKKDIAYMISRHASVLPLGVYCACLLISSMIHFASMCPEKCADIIDLVNKSEINNHHICISNWICEDAKTLEFHQEFDSSYTFLCVPFWDKTKFQDPNNKKARQSHLPKKGNANFLFKWSSHKHEDIFLPIEMTDGISILFSGFGCYHRQHRTDSDGIFWNYGTYLNRSFYHKLRCSVARCLNISSTEDTNPDRRKTV